MRVPIINRGKPGKTVIILMVLLIASAISVPAAARYSSPEGSNAGVDPGDTVFNGERGLNFSTFQAVPPLLPPLWLACNDGGSALAMQTLYDIAVLRGRLDVGSSYLDRPFKLYNGSWADAICTVSEPTGSIEVRTGTALGTDVDPAVTDTKTPAVIPALMNVQFKLDSTNLNNGNFINPWYDLELTTPGNVPIRTITNMNGDTVSLTGLIADPSANNNALAFSIADQNPNPEEGTYEMKFTAYNGNDSFYTVDYEFDVVRYKLSASVDPSTVQMDQSTTLTIVGKPYMYYTIVIEDTMDGKPELPASGNYDIYTSKYNATVHPDWSGTVNVQLYIPVVEGDYSRTTRMFYPKIYETNNPSTYIDDVQIVVQPGTSQDIVMDDVPLSDDEYYCLGDTITVAGSLAVAAPDDMNIYFYVKGPNLNENGAKPSDPKIPVVDGNNATFDSIEIDKGTKDFTYKWDTSKTGLAAATYTIFATTEPVGYESRSLAEGEVKDYVSIDLNDPSINVKFPEEAPGFFAKGDHIVSLWSARGSPAKTSYYGTIRYYILGTNFRYTGFRQFPLMKVDADATNEQMSVLADEHDFPGYSGLNLPRSFSNNMSEGSFYVVYQHPMNNQVFDVLPTQGDDYSGKLTTIETSEGTVVDLSSFEAKVALNVLMDTVDSSMIDDSMVSQTFAIEEPSMNINSILNYEVGEAIPVVGTTNLECPIEYPYNQIDLSGDSIDFSVYESDMYYAGKTQSTYRVYHSSDYPQKPSVGEDARKISLSIPIEISAQMKAGDYVGLIKCEEIKYQKAFLFTLHEEGYRKEHGIASPSIGDEFAKYVVSTYAGSVSPQTETVEETVNEATIAPATTIAPASSNSAGFGSLFYIKLLGVLALCVLLYSARR